MDRRQFLGAVSTTVAVAGAVNLDAAPATGSKGAGARQLSENRRVTYRVKGFTCITCAVGLEVMLRGLNGVTRADASYPDHTAVIGFDERVVSEEQLKRFIGACGFSLA